MLLHADQMGQDPFLPHGPGLGLRDMREFCDVAGDPRKAIVASMGVAPTADSAGGGAPTRCGGGRASHLP